MIIVITVKIAVIPLMALAKKKYQHHENAQPGGFSIEVIYTISAEK
jgi:hypothetical protein